MTDGDPAPVRVVLVGFMASGKTSVGERLARLLGWRFTDFDAEIEARAGASIPEIFARQGEEAFRELEARVGRRLLQEEDVVLATGGGWAATEGRLTDLPEGTLSVWLRVGPEEAVRRAGSGEGERPLLDVADPVGRARELLEQREPLYGRAMVTLDAEEASPGELARAIARMVQDPPAQGSSTPNPSDEHSQTSEPSNEKSPQD